jgi:hypothetical protein
MNSVDEAPIAGTLFFETDAHVNPSMKKGPATVLEMSIITRGSVSVSSNAVLQPYHEDLLLVSGGDVKLTGSASATQFSGLVYVHGTYKMAGTGALDGSVIVENAAGEDPAVSLDGQAKIKLTGKGPKAGGNQGAVAADWYEDSASLYKAVFK